MIVSIKKKLKKSLGKNVVKNHIFSRTFFNGCYGENEIKKKTSENILLILRHKHILKNSVKNKKLSLLYGKQSKFWHFFAFFFFTKCSPLASGQKRSRTLGTPFKQKFLPRTKFAINIPCIRQSLLQRKHFFHSTNCLSLCHIRPWNK